MVFYSLNLDTAGTGGKSAGSCRADGMEDFYAEKYLDTLRVGAETESDELFDKSHGFYIAVIQGFSEITITPEAVPFLSWWNKRRNMRGTSPHGIK